MLQVVSDICELLDSCASQLVNTATSPDYRNATLLTIHGWNYQALTFQHLSSIASGLSNRFKATEFDADDSQVVWFLEATRSSLQQFMGQSFQYFFNGNAAPALPAFMDLMQWISTELSNRSDWQTIPANKMPARLVQKVQRAEQTLSQLQPDLEKLERTVANIRAAQVVSDELPIALQDLQHAEKEVKGLSKEAHESLGIIKERASRVVALIDEVASRRAEIEELLRKSADALSASTTVSLAKSFKDRSDALSGSIRWWVGMLGFTLLIGMSVGLYNYSHIADLLRADNPAPWKLVTYVALAILSVGAPVWFAWMSTKQIGQRFKLAEDYAFKAAVASAYEGYKRETAVIDPELTKKLLASALVRLDENPLRYADEGNHGSPVHELATSSGARGIIDRLVDRLPGGSSGKAGEE